METRKFIVDVQADGKIVSQTEYNPTPQVVYVSPVPKLVPYGIGVVGLAILAFLSVFIVKQQSLKIIERFGKFKRVAKPGINVKIPFVDKVVSETDLRIQQLVVGIETKTKDNVFSLIKIAVQYFVISEKAYESFYKLDNPQKQIEAYVYDVVRSQVPKLTLDETFEKKDDIAVAVKKELSTIMDDFGYSIVTALVVDIEPAANVKESMNNINAAQRDRVAANERGEAEKILAIKRAEAESESKRLSGEGTANERKAIIKGFEESIAAFSTSTGIKSDEVMGLVLMTQYFDTIRSVGDKGNATVFLPSSPAGMKNIGDEIRNAMLSAAAVNTK